MNPNFFIVGVPKSGTTSIYNYLKSHQDVFMSKKKEINFFSNQEILSQNLYYNNSVCDSMENYLKHFINSENYKVVGEASVSYLFYQNVAEKIYKFLLKNKIDVLFDDTDEHLSAKFKKFDLLGIPYQIILGSKSSGDKFEFKEVGGKTESLSLEDIKNKLLNNRS